MSHAKSIFWLDACLFADFVCSNSINCPVSFDGKCLDVVRINRVIGTFAQQTEAVLFEVFHQISTLN
jgi:hypothetical protein